MEDLIDRLSKARKNNEDKSVKDTLTITLQKKELQLIITSLKMYNAFESMLDEEIELKCY